MDRPTLTYSSVREPRWADAGMTCIICLVKFDHIKPEVEFVANPNDVEEHGREIFHRCLAGDFGAVAAYVNPPEAEGYAPPVVPNPPFWLEANEFLNQANAEIQNGTARGVVLVWSSMIETLLGRLLESYLVEHSVSRSLIWKDANSSLGTFSGRSKIAFALGLLSRRELTSCNHVRSVRNFAAHHWNFQLESPEFAQKALPALRGLYDQHHSDFYEWQESSFHFLIVSIYAGSCGVLVSSLIQRRSDAINWKRQEVDVLPQ